MTPNSDERLLVDSMTGDDAAVYQLDADRALVFTADFITPLVDDAAQWGAIAAANSLSDIYAMGGRPLLALNLVGWNREELPLEVLADVLTGAQSKAAEAGVVIAGGHTVDDPEPKFGLAVVGEIHPDKILRNSTMQAGQNVVLTKPLGIGVISTALKQGKASADAAAAATTVMTQLNSAAAEIALRHQVKGATDVTGFGLLGHLARAALESKLDITIEVSSVPLIEGVAALAAQGLVPGGSRRNLLSVESQLEVSGVGGARIDEVTLLLLADAQTSGGLVFTVDDNKTKTLLAELEATGHTAAVIGTSANGSGKILLR